MVLGYMLVSKLAVMAVIRAIVLSTQQSDTPLQELTPLVQAVIGYNRPGGFNENIRFLLYREKSAIFNPFKFSEIKVGNLTSLRSSGYDPSLHVKILVHGYGGAFLTAFPLDLRNAYLLMQASTPRNIIVTDWTGLSNVLYHQAVANAAGVGKRLGEFLCWLHQEQMIQLSTTHIVGLSLGAGVLGAAGAEVQERCGQLVSRITALDPARLGYEPPFIGARRVYPEDAAFVDVVHTNTELFGFGITENWGHADYYVNGGVRQPGCPVLDPSCSHVTAAFYYAETVVNMEKTPICACHTAEVYERDPSCCHVQVPFGEYGVHGIQGRFYFNYTLTGPEGTRRWNDTLQL